MNTKEPENTPASKEISKATLRRRKHVAANRAGAQRDKLDERAEARAEKAAAPSKGRQDQKLP